MNIPFITNHLTIQNLINCYVRETGRGEWRSAHEVPVALGDERIKQVLVISLEQQSITLYFPVQYKSVTDRHLFTPVTYYQVKNEGAKELDYITLLASMQKEFSLTSNKPVQTAELMLRTILSYQNMKGILSERSDNLEECYQMEKTFLQSEQSLLVGHQVHPTPKSRQGIDVDEEHIFAPERKGAFQLHYFRAVNDIVEEDSILSQNASELIKEGVKKDPFVSQSFKDEYCRGNSFSLIPVHPLQARKLLGREDVGNLIQLGKLDYLGPHGRKYYPTSSVRTVYHPEASFMYKFSIPVKITNSLRINKRKELNRGVEVSRLLHGELREKLTEAHPSFRIIEDPAYITLKLGLEETGFEVVIRENSFQAGNDSRTTLLAALCQDHIAGGSSHLANIIYEIAGKENISIAAASEQWFVRYLKVGLRPLYWLYATYGIALEAHQQNSIIKLDEQGYPSIFYYRDNQGYYFMESKANALKQLVPTLNEKSDTICADSIAEERFRYYVFFNHLFGLINAFGVNRLIDEHRLLEMMRVELSDFKKQLGDHTNLLDSLLYEEKLPCKANLLTRVHDMDELEGSMETQSVYVHLTNPLVVAAGGRHV
ncbi:siderophore biosynthesis protein [Virgibacillus phasianinus]|uniref:Siderophore biosynthesis protein n=1 Tax=Virgibacillus phasianinus TaxID=2017483 RepID=A0A220U7E8_9BACI|nr:IucA/IucC family siderophore biosynthesis protein [Virgibacillus phasianinus]ASK64058.1 siderophore biosynthesis protein [Virgibacillus phasianinus]